MNSGVSAAKNRPHEKGRSVHTGTVPSPLRLAFVHLKPRRCIAARSPAIANDRSHNASPSGRAMFCSRAARFTALP